MGGYLPPGCTQDECDRAQPGYSDDPQQWFVCDACDGAGEVPTNHGYEDAEPCGKCGGAGGWLDEMEHDR